MHELMWDSHLRAMELRRRVEEGRGDRPCVPPKPPEQRVYAGATNAHLNAETRVCSMGPWEETLYISIELRDMSRLRDMAQYQMGKIFRRLSLVNAVVREDRDF